MQFASHSDYECDCSGSGNGTASNNTSQPLPLARLYLLHFGSGCCFLLCDSAFTVSSSGKTRASNEDTFCVEPCTEEQL